MEVIHAALLADANADLASLPTAFRLFVLGKNVTSKGTFVLDKAGLTSVMAAYVDHGIDMSFDYEHQALGAPGKSPAAAWFKPEARDDGLWAVDVRWTPPATEMLRNKEYRFFSPAFATDKQNRITRLINVALTNLPATKNQEALVAASQVAQPLVKETKAMPNIAAIIGLKDDADEAEVEGRAVSLAGLERDLLNATGADSIGAAMAAVVSLKSIAADNESLRKDVADFQALRDREEADRKRKSFDAVMLSCFDSGKVSRKDEDQIQRMTSLFDKHGLEALETCVAALRGAPPRVYQSAVPTNIEEQRLREYHALRAANPSMDSVTAGVAAASKGAR